jgi:hypothetical protein
MFIFILFIFMFIFLVVRSARFLLIHDLLDQGVGVGGAVNKKFGCKSVDDDWGGFSV